MALIDSKWERLPETSRTRDLPDDILFNILSRLPVKSILRFKSVCKKWYALFGESRFIEAHLNQSMEVSDGCYLALQYGCSNEKTGSYKGNLFSLRSAENFEEMCELSFEFNPDSVYDVIAAAGGIVCFVEHVNGSKYKFNWYLWNPATRELRILPGFLGQGSRNEHCLGFGFDRKHNDYKAVALTCFTDSYELNVYSLRMDSWRVVEVDLSHKISPYTGRVYVNDRTHWLGGGPFLELHMFLFDFTEEKIFEMDVPEFEFEMDIPVFNPIDHAVLLESPASLGKSLFLCYFTSPPSGFQVWYMKEYGDPKSWTKIYYFFAHSICASCICPLVYLDYGKVVIICYEDLVLYDPQNCVHKNLNVRGKCFVVKYKESLASVEGGGSISNLDECASIFDRSLSTISLDPSK